MVASSKRLSEAYKEALKLYNQIGERQVRLPVSIAGAISQSSVATAMI